MKMNRAILLLVIVWMALSSSVKAEIDVIDIKCAINGEDDGSITIAISGGGGGAMGAGPFGISLDHSSFSEPLLGEITGPTGGVINFENLPSGNYFLYVENQLGCIAQENIEVCEMCELGRLISDFQHVTLCSDCPDQPIGCTGKGYIQTDIDLSTFNVTWDLDGDLFEVDDPNNLNNLLEGTYTIKVEDKLSPETCNESESVTIFVCQDRMIVNDECIESSSYLASLLPYYLNNPIVIQPSESELGAIIWHLNLDDTGLDFYWEDLEGNKYPGTSIDGLQEGQYCFKIQSPCGNLNGSLLMDYFEILMVALKFLIVLKFLKKLISPKTWIKILD